MSALIEFQSVCKYYQMGDTTVKAADHISFQIQKGEFVAIVGQSGSGKSTCMNIIGCLDVPTSGAYLLDGQDVGRMDRNQLAEIRNKMLGFIFQQYNLLPKLNLQENVEVPLMYAGIPTTPFILSFVLGSQMENYFRKAISYGKGDWTLFFTRPVSCILLIVAVGSVFVPLIKEHLAKKKAAAAQ